jgi:hypothetical protein
MNVEVTLRGNQLHVTVICNNQESLQLVFLLLAFVSRSKFYISWTQKLQHILITRCQSQSFQFQFHFQFPKTYFGVLRCGFFGNLFTQKPDSMLLAAAKSGRMDKLISALAAGATLEAQDKVSLH